MGPKNWTSSSATDSSGGGIGGLRSKISKTLGDNNLLGLPEAERANMVEILLKCETRKELTEWCTGTLMLADSLVADMIKGREDLGLLFVGDSVPGKAGGGSSSSSASASHPKAAAVAPVSSAALETGSENPSLASLTGGSVKSGGSGGSGGGKKRSGNQKNSRGPMEEPDDTASVASTSVTSMSQMSQTGAKKAGKGKKGVPLAQAPGGDNVVKGVEMECGCFASQHQFKGNCVNCGRIICEQEGEEICYSCGLDPNRCIAYELKVELGNIDTATQSKNAAMYKAALERRDNLLQYARERTKRTQIIDDQAGQYNNTAWLSAEERAEAKAADNDQRKKVAALHRASGAYQVHLDIVQQSVHLGATTIQNSGDSGSTTGGTGSRGCSEDYKKDAAAIAAAIERHSDPTVGGDGTAGETGTEEDEDVPALGEEEEEEDLRVLPLPSLLQKVWYSAGDEDSVTLAQRAKEDQLRQKQNKLETKEQRETAAKARDRIHDAKRLGSDKKGSGEVKSLRVQNDYYEEDQVEFAVQRQILGLEEKQMEFNKKVLASAASKSFGAMAEDQYALQLRREAGEHMMQELLLQEEEEDAQHHGAGAAASGGGGSLVPTAGSSSISSGPIPTGLKSTKAPLYTIPSAWRGKDEGMCLSMHQPWASLLVQGIKTHEGRTWPTNFRGRLWIHAAAAKPNDVESVEAHARQYVPEGTKFPTHYPTSCLLGYTYLVDCLSLEDYQEKFPIEQQQGQGSPYTFICLGSKSCPMMLQMDGDHKLFKLEKKLWLAAKAQLGERKG